MNSPHEHKLGIIMNGVTGRMGTNQHLMQSIVAFIKEGGVKLAVPELDRALKLLAPKPDKKR